MKPAVDTKLAKAIEQGWLEFDVRAPYRGMLSPKEAAAALGLVWMDVHGEPKRFATDFIFELLESGEIEGLAEPSKGPEVKYTRPDGSTGKRAPKPRFTRVTRSSLMLYCARRWNITPEQAAGIILDSARNLPTGAMRALAEAIVKAADAREQSHRDREEIQRHLKRA